MKHAWLSAIFVVALSSVASVRAASVFTTDTRVRAMVGEVNRTTVSSFVATLSGETTATVGGAPYRILTRATGSGTPIAKATQYAHEYMVRKGLGVTYHQWSPEAPPSLVATTTGTTRASEIVLVIAHLDDAPTSGIAPGADDDASGVAAIMAAADICSRRKFQRTIRFVLFTGFEQSLLPCDRYAQDAHDRGDNIVAVLNLDMIGYNNGTARFEMHTRAPTEAGYAPELEMAGMITKIVPGYGLSSSLIPALRSGQYYTAVNSFRKYGYPGLLLIEQKEDFNPYPHTADDRLSKLDTLYLQNVTKVAVALVGHLAMLAPPPNSAGGSAYLYR